IGGMALLQRIAEGGGEERVRVRRGGLARCAGGRAGGVDFVLPGGDNARLDMGELRRRVAGRVALLVDVGPSGADMRFAVEGIALGAVRLVAGVGIGAVVVGGRLL